MRASVLSSLIPGAVLKGADIDISGITDDTRKIKPGLAFIALKGTVTDGHNYIDIAAGKGASVIIRNTGYNQPASETSVIEVPDTRDALDKILPAMFPSAEKVRLAGITGTSGKTSTTYLLESIIKASWRKPGVIGTINIRYPGKQVQASVTTPGPVELFGILDEMGINGVDICVMEVSSHALDQGRIDGLSFDTAVFMNLSHEHLDYHHDMETYYLAKKKLFTDYLKGTAIVNIDDEAGRRLAGELGNPLTFGNSKDAAIRPHAVRTDLGPMIIYLDTPAGRFELVSSLLGRFQVNNIMAAVGAAFAFNIDIGAIVEGIASIRFVPGRMEPVGNSAGLRILVDYAHKPEALENALQAAKEITRGRLITVFGCGGDRDRAKRPLMAAIAERLADAVIVTSDNPRTENPNDIIREIMTGFSAGYKPFVEPDRATAIKLGVAMMEPDDILIIAGKGHEDYQIIGGKKYPFDDRVIVRAAVDEVSA